MMNSIFTNTQLFASQDINRWTGIVDYYEQIIQTAYVIQVIRWKDSTQNKLFVYKFDIPSLVNC